MSARSSITNVWRFSWAAVGASLVAAATLGGTLDKSKLPLASSAPVTFARDIRPLLETRCYRCHGPERPKSGFRLDTRSSALKGGDNGVAILPGKSADSPLIHYVARLVEDMEMPPAGKGEPLTPVQVGLLRTWIDQGANWSGSAAATTKARVSVTPSIGWIGVSGDKQQFREHSGLKEGWSGGIREFWMEERSADGVLLTTEGRGRFDQNDYQLKVSLRKPDVGFARFGFEQFRRYDDDAGGFYAPFGTNSFSLDRDLHTDFGRVWFDVGLTLPKWPRVTLGYEYQFKEGAQSSLAWSDVALIQGTSGQTVRSIQPAYKDIDENAHVLKLDLSHEWRGARFEDSFRAEFYDLDSRRAAFDPITIGQKPTGGGTRFSEEYNHFQAVNSFRVEKRLKDWLLLGGGYLYSRLDGDGTLSREAFTPSGVLPTRPPDETGPPIVIRRESHVYNLGSLWGPWDGLTLSAGLQNEWTHEDGFGQGLFRIGPPDQTPVRRVSSSQRDKAILQEDLGLRYTRIPHTVLFADARFRQEWIDHFERDEYSPDSSDFMRDTDATVDMKELRAGMAVSPWRRVSWNASYRHQLSRSDYEHNVDTSPTLLDPSFGIDPSNGYPAFIRRRDIELDEFETRLVLHPANWIKATLKYQLISADYRTVTDPSVDLFSSSPQPGGKIFAGDYDAHVYSASATLTPWRRLNLSGTFSYSDARTVTGVNGRASQAPYDGGIFSVLAAANLVINPSTDWNASYSFYHADFRQSNDETTLPLGIQYERHGLITGISRRFGKKLTANLQYGFFHYAEPSSKGVNDYTAHALFASLRMVFD